MSRVFSLSFHANYRCAHSGVCCSSDWDVPVELPIFVSLEAALQRQLVTPASSGPEARVPLLTGDDLPDDTAAMLARTESGHCVFFHRDSHLCVVHRDAGEGMLPATCRHFPRVAVADARGTFISLTHYCPTAAATLFRSDVPVEIVESPEAFPPADYEGLTVGLDEWPPLLHSTMLMDGAAYSAWERHMIARCADPSPSPESVLATLRRDARVLQAFSPGGVTLAEAIAALPSALVVTAQPDTLASSVSAFTEAMNAVPDELKPVPDDHGLEESFAHWVRPNWENWHLPLKRFLAAKAFANWTAYQGRGVLAIVRGLEAALSLVRVEAARQCRDAARPLDQPLLLEAFRWADFTLNHLAVGEELATSWSAAEQL